MSYCVCSFNECVSEDSTLSSSINISKPRSLMLNLLISTSFSSDFVQLKSCYSPYSLHDGAISTVVI